MNPAAADREWMRKAIALSRQCPPAPGAYSVGAIIVGSDGVEIARGYSREGNDPHAHAEESALEKLSKTDERLTAATLYSTLEPCTTRKSRPQTCAQLIIGARVPRVVIAWREPPLFVADCQGVENLQAAGIEVHELDELAESARRVNSHLPV